MPRKTLFRTNRTEVKTITKTAIPETTIATSPPTPSPDITAWIEAALEKANTAVLFDFTGSPKQAMESYNEAIDLLKRVFAISDTNDDQTRLKKIYESYIERVGILSLQLDHNELDDSTSLSIPIAQESQNLPLPPSPEKCLPTLPSTPTTAKTKSSTPPPLDLTSNSKLLKHSQKSPKLPSKSPKLLPTKSPKSLSTKSSSNSLFSNMFSKKSQQQQQQNKNNNSNTVNTSSSLFSMPAPSKSTPTLSLNRSNLTSWKKSSQKKKHRHSTEIDALDIEPLPFNNSHIELPHLPIPHMDPLTDNDDYFDLQSIMETKDLLYAQPEPMLESLRDLHQKEDSILLSNSGSNNSDNINSNKTSLDIPEPPLMSNSSSNDTYFSTCSINKQQQQQQQQPLASSASSIMTTSTSFTKSIYSPTRSSFYSTNFSYRHDDDYSIASSKNPISTSTPASPPPPLPLFLNNDLLNLGNDNDTSNFDMESFAKVLAQSAANMPDRHHRRTNTANNNNTTTTIPTVNTIKELENEEEEESENKKINNNSNKKDLELKKYQLSRTTSHKSVTSVKSYESTTTGRSSTSSHTLPPLPNKMPTPTPSTSTKSAKSEPTSSFWSKKSKTTKPKTFKPLAPINVLNHHENDDDHTKKATALSSISSPPPPPPMTASTTYSDIISPVTPPTTKSFTFGIISPTNSTSKISSSSHHHYSNQKNNSSSNNNRNRSTSMNKGVDMKIAMGDYLHNTDNKQPKLMARLLQSMEEGGYITDKIHAPKQLWYQTHVRLPAIDAKINACEQILTLLYRMQSRSLDHPHHESEALEDFGRLEIILDTMKQSFGKVNHHHHDNQQQPQQSTTASASIKHLSIIPSTSTELQQQQLHSKSMNIQNNNNNNNNKEYKATWSSKLSKSVERMKLDNKPSEEQICTYIKTLIRLFSLASVLDEWRDNYMEMTRTVSMEKTYIYDLLLQKTMMCTGTLHSVVCGFVMRDFAILLNKWMKRSRDWLFDD